MAERDTGFLAPKTISDKATAFARQLRLEEDTNYDESDNKYDAIRHIGGVLALYAQYPDTASDIITGGKEYLDEYLLGGEERSVEMDRHNNEIARKLYQMLPEEQADKLTTEQALRIAKEYVEGWEDAPEGENPMDLPDSMRPQIIYGKTKEPKLSEDEGPLYRKGADGTWELKEQPAEMNAGGLMLAPGGAVGTVARQLAKKATKEETTDSPMGKYVLAPTALAMGVIATPEEAEAAYIPLKAFKEGTDVAKQKFDEVQRLLDQGIDDSPGGELYQRTGAYRSEDGDIKVDVAELKALDVEMGIAVGKFTEDAEFFINNPKKTRKEIRSKISDYLPANSPIFKNFPELRDVTVVLRRGKRTNNKYTDETNVYGAFYPTSKEMHILFSTEGDDIKTNLRDPVKAFNTLVHEFQHHIQDVKGAASNGFSTVQTGVFATKMKDEIPRLRKLIADEPNNEKAKAQLKQYTDLLEDAKVDIDSFVSGKYDESIKRLIDGERASYAIYVRDLGEAEARSSGRKAFLAEDDPTRKEMGVFYPATSKDPGTLEAIKIGSEKQLPREQILVRRYPGQRYKEAHLDFVDPDTKQRVPPKLAVAGTTATGLAAATPSEAFVGSLGFEDPTPSPSLIGAEGLEDIPLEQQILLDQLAPKTKPYDLITSIPGVDLATMFADLTYEAGESTKMEEGEEQPEAVDEFSDMEKDVAGGLQAGGFVGDVYNQPYQPPQNLPPTNTDPSDKEMADLNLRQGGGVETEAGVEMEQEGKKKFELDREKADLNNDGKLSSYEKARGEAIQKDMAEMNAGGMMSDPFAPLQVVIGIDSESGNHIPAGSKAEEVRDDIPAMLSEGEYVMPADVVRWHGLKKMEELRCEAKHALGLMAKHDRIAMVDDDTKEPVEHEEEEIEYEIEEKDKPEVEEAEVEVVEAQTGADIQTTDEEGVEPLPPITYYRYETRWDPAANRYKRVPIDPITGEVVTAETFEQERATRYGFPQVFGKQKVRCPEGYEYDEEKQICMPIKSEQEQVAEATRADSGGDGEGFDQGLATEPGGYTSLKDYESYQLAEALGPNRDLVTPEQALERMTTPTDVKLPTGISALSIPAQIMSRVGRFADAVGAQRAALQREDLIQAAAKEIAEGKIDEGRLPTTYDFTFNPDTASFEKSTPTQITEITDVEGKPIVTDFDYVGTSGRTYTSDEIFEDDAKFADVFGEGFERGTPVYSGMGALGLEPYSATTTPSLADVYDLGEITGLAEPTTTGVATDTLGVGTTPSVNARGENVSTTSVTDRAGNTTTVTTTTDPTTGSSSSFLDADGDGVKDSNERGVVTSGDGSPVTSGSGSVVTSRSADEISGGNVGRESTRGGISGLVDNVSGITTGTSTTSSGRDDSDDDGGGFGEGVSGAGAGGFGGDDDTSVSTGGDDSFDTTTFDDIADDPDWGGGGDDGGDDDGGGTYCCTRMIEYGLWSPTRELAMMYKWHYQQPQWWRDGYDVWGKVIADTVLSTKSPFWTRVMQEFYEHHARKKKATIYSVIGDLTIYPGSFVFGMLAKFTGRHVNVPQESSS